MEEIERKRDEERKRSATLLAQSEKLVMNSLREQSNQLNEIKLLVVKCERLRVDGENAKERAMKAESTVLVLEKVVRDLKAQLHEERKTTAGALRQLRRLQKRQKQLLLRARRRE